MASYRALRPCHRVLTPRYRQLVAEAAGTKRVHRVTSRAEIAALLRAVEREYAGRSALSVRPE